MILFPVTVRDRQAQFEFAAAPEPRARCGDRAAVELDQALDERESETHAPLSAIEAAIDLREYVEDALEHFLLDSDAGVGDADPDGFALHPCSDLDSPA